MKVFVNGKIVPLEKAKVSVLDGGFLYGDGIYETVLARNKNVFRLNQHINRLFHSAKLISLKLPWSQKIIKNAVYKTLRANKLESARIRITISRGEMPFVYKKTLKANPTFIIIANQFDGWPNTFYEKGIKAIISKTRRNHPLSLNPIIKSTNCLNQIFAANEANKKNAFESIMLNLEGYISEGTISNVFFVKKNEVFTPGLESGILDGVTRRIVISLAMKENIYIKETLIRPGELLNADECFLTSTTLKVMPVTYINNKKIGPCVPGPVTFLLNKKLNELIQKETQ